MTLPVTGHPARDRWVRSMFGCEWGRRVASTDDLAPCESQAFHLLVLHHGEHELPVKVCARHYGLILANTTEHKFGEDDEGK